MKKIKAIIGFTLSGVFTALFLIFTAIVSTVDVAAAGPNGSLIGLSTVNVFFFEKFGTNEIFYKISEAIGVLALALAFVFFLVGLVQLIKRKNLWKVDLRIIILGGAYLLIATMFFAFEFFVINYRPILVNGELEASYPSSHTMVVACVFIMSIPFINSIFAKKPAIKVIAISLCIILTILTETGRLVSGMHWFSDVAGALLISGAIISLFYAFLALFYKKPETPENNEIEKSKKAEELNEAAKENER